MRSTLLGTVEPETKTFVPDKRAGNSTVLSADGNINEMGVYITSSLDSDNSLARLKILFAMFSLLNITHLGNPVVPDV